MSNQNVIVYTSHNCTYCEKVVSKLSEWEIDFEERNISENREYFRNLQSLKIYGTPATFVDGEEILGFQERTLKRALGIKNEERFLNTDTMKFS